MKVFDLVMKHCVEYLILLMKKKGFLTEKLEMQNRAVFHCHIQTPIKH